MTIRNVWRRKAESAFEKQVINYFSQSSMKTVLDKTEQ